MATYFCNPESGDDGNNGSTWALAKKNPSAFSALSGGDIVRVAKSPDPTLVGQATWTDLSNIVTLNSAVTKTVDNCEDVWTAGDANVTASYNTTSRKQGSRCAYLTIAAGFSTGKIAYYPLGSVQDFSAYQQLSFWFRNQSVAVAANSLKLCLCSDTAGNDIVDEFIIPAIPSTAYWVAFTINKGSALGNSIQSVALHALTDPGTQIIYLDNIIACKAPSAADSLSLTSLIGKNTTDECWYVIQSIVDTEVRLDLCTDCVANYGGNYGYAGTSGSNINTYKREPIKTAMLSSSSAYLWNLPSGVAGSVDSYTHFMFGCDTSIPEGTQNGYSFFSGQNGLGRAISASANFIKFSNVGFSRYSYGTMFSSSYVHQFDKLYCTANYSGNWIGRGRGDNLYINNNPYRGFQSFLEQGDNFRVYCNVGNGIEQSSQGKFTNVHLIKNNAFGIQIGFGTVELPSLTTRDNIDGAVTIVSGGAYLKGANISEAVELVVSDTSKHGAKIFSHDHDGTSGNHKIAMLNGLISSESTVRHTASGISWKMSPTSDTVRTSSFPVDLIIAKVACSANALVTIKGWFRRDNIGLAAKLVCRGGQIAGVDSDVEASMTAVADTWEELTITFTPTESGVVEIEAQCHGGATYNAYVDDMTISQAA